VVEESVTQKQKPTKAEILKNYCEEIERACENNKSDMFFSIKKVLEQKYSEIPFTDFIDMLSVQSQARIKNWINPNELFLIG